MAISERKMIDCRQVGKSSGCTLAIFGTEQEVLETAVLHAVKAHGMTDTPELRDQLCQAMQSAEQRRAA